LIIFSQGVLLANKFSSSIAGRVCDYMPWIIGDLDKPDRNFSAGFAAETIAISILAVKAVGKRQAIRATAGIIRQAFIHMSIDMAGPTQSRIRKRAGKLHQNTPLPGLYVALLPSMITLLLRQPKRAIFHIRRSGAPPFIAAELALLH
jgi:hypothetical protein